MEEGSGKDFSLALQVSIERCRRTKKARVSSFELIPKLPYNIIGQTLHNCPNALYFFQNVSRQGSTDLKSPAAKPRKYCEEESTPTTAGVPTGKLIESRSE